MLCPLDGSVMFIGAFVRLCQVDFVQMQLGRKGGDWCLLQCDDVFV